MKPKLINGKAYSTKPPEVEKKQRKFLQRRVRYLQIDSRDRDITLYPDANNYVIDVSKENFTNVTKIQVVSTKFTNVSSDNSDIFITSNVIGNDFTVSDNNNNLSKIFGKIQMPGVIDDIIFNSYVACKKVYYDNSLLDILQTIDFQFKNYDGTLLDFNDKKINIYN